MNFELSEEQAMLRDSVQRFVQGRYDFAEWRAVAASASGMRTENWATYAEMGWLALPFAEENGGLGGTALDVNVITEALGAGMTMEPYLASVLLAGRMVELLGNPAQRAALLPEVAEGRQKLALAYGEVNARYDLSFVEATATAAEMGGSGDYRITGHKAVVLGAAVADQFVVIARTSGEVTDRDGLSAFLVSASAPGLRLQTYPLVDGQQAADLWLSDVPAQLLGAEGQALSALEQVIDSASCAICAEAVGAMQVVLQMTRDYVSTRQQFGRAIGTNQVIEHRLVDMFTAVEEAKALTDITTMRLVEDPVAAAPEVAAMKAKVGQAARFVGAQGVQLHGGIGMTDEYPVGHYFKRLMVLDVLFGDSAHHLGRFADTL